MRPVEDPRLAAHNLQWQGRDTFLAHDPTLRRMRAQRFVHDSPLLTAIPLTTPGIYTLVGGRQVGKSTMQKQLMARLMEDGVAPEKIAYVTCEPFADAEDLRRVLTTFLASVRREACWLFLDEVTYVDGWDRTVKFLADAGELDSCFLLATGSDQRLIEDSLKRLPGRRGRAAVVDFHLRPLSFLEFCELRQQVDRVALAECAAAELPDPIEAGPLVDDLERELRDYHLTGGFLPAIHDQATHGEVEAATLRIYADWIRGDVLRLDRNERYLREVLTGVHRRQGSQVTWHALAKELSIDHPKTIADYIGILARMDALLVVPALAEHTRGPAPKKARKVFFADPFIHRAVAAWLAIDDVQDSEERLQRDLEAVFAAHVARFAEVYYIKAAGEIDVAWFDRSELQLIEVKWSTQLRPAELKEITRRGKGLIAARVHRSATWHEIPIVPAAVVLLRLAARSVAASA